MWWRKLKVSAILLAMRWGLVAVGMWITWAYITDGKYDDWPSIRTLASAFLLLLYLFVGLPFGKKALRLERQRKAQLLHKMQGVYLTLKPGDLLSPNQIRSALLDAQNDGAVWDAAIFALLDRAALRDPPVWIL